MLCKNAYDKQMNKQNRQRNFGFTNVKTQNFRNKHLERVGKEFWNLSLRPWNQGPSQRVFSEKHYAVLVLTQTWTSLKISVNMKVQFL